MSDYGPQHEQVVAMIERTRVLTAEEVTALGVAWYAAWGAAWGAARGVARDAAWDAAWGADRRAAWDADLDAVWYAARYAARGAARDTACALVARDLIGQYGFTQEQYDLLTGAWRTTIGPIHPDDKDRP